MPFYYYFIQIEIVETLAIYHFNSKMRKKFLMFIRCCAEQCLHTSLTLFIHLFIHSFIFASYLPASVHKLVRKKDEEFFDG
jgi:cell division protein FtsB